jgi:DeoR family transcriptional regulator, glycerol-3-phosphate regulon repressor
VPAVAAAAFLSFAMDPRMLAEQRHHYILDRLTQQGALSISELVKHLQVSRETVRRDLNALAQRGLLLMTHGGALAPGRREPDIGVRETSNALAKHAIGLRAAEFVPDEASLVIDSGTTTLAVARALGQRRRLTVYTNDWHVGLLLGRRNENRVTLLGGELAEGEDAAFGLDTLHQLAQYRADFAFVGAGGISAEAGLTDYSRAAAELRGKMLMSATVPIVVADHTKFGRATPVKIAHFEQAHYLISDQAPERKLRRALEALGPELVLAPIA